jgi:excisionase family DNA binding protein
MTEQPQVVVLNPAYWVEKAHQLAQILRNDSILRISDPTGDVLEPAAPFTVVFPGFWGTRPDVLRDALADAAGMPPANSPTSALAPGVAGGGPGRLTLTVEEAAQALGISRAFAYESVRRGDIPHIKIGRRVLIPRVALDQLLASATSDDREQGSPT